MANVEWKPGFILDASVLYAINIRYYAIPFSRVRATGLMKNQAVLTTIKLIDTYSQVDWTEALIMSLKTLAAMILDNKSVYPQVDEGKPSGLDSIKGRIQSTLPFVVRRCHEVMSAISSVARSRGYVVFITSSYSITLDKPNRCVLPNGLYLLSTC